MRLEHSFTVPVPVASAWQVLLDLPRIAPCLPGATLTGVQDDTFTGTVKVKLGPIALTYQGTGRFVERDEAARRVVVEASGRDVRSAGTAAATVTATLADDGGATKVEVLTELTVTGKPAQFGRGMIADVGGRLIGQFADCLATTLGGQQSRPVDRQRSPEPASAVSVGGNAAGAARAAAAGSTYRPARVAPSTGRAPSPRGEALAGGHAASTGEDSVTAGGPAAPAIVPTVAAPAPTAAAPDPTVARPHPTAARPHPTAATPDPTVGAPAEAEPIDLFRLTRGTATARRATRYGVTAVLLAGLAWWVSRRLRR